MLTILANDTTKDSGDSDWFSAITRSIMDFKVYCIAIDIKKFSFIIVFCRLHNIVQNIPHIHARHLFENAL
jgi:hypothetical protein